eukprot:scaffold86223_cov62-Phaeocystis_antarctica.AAC.5
MRSNSLQGFPYGLTVSECRSPYGSSSAWHLPHSACTSVRKVPSRLPAGSRCPACRARPRSSAPPAGSSPQQKRRPPLPAPTPGTPPRAVGRQRWRCPSSVPWRS